MSRLGLAALALLIAASVAMPAQAALAATSAPDAATASPLLSQVGAKAINDLRECIASNPSKKLDVYYLIDASGSLFKDSSKPKGGTDPGFVRAELIGNSLAELGTLGDGIQLSYGLGFFGENFKKSINWTTINGDLDAQKSRIQSAIKKQTTLGWTNWETGISNAQKQLSAQHAKTGGCQLMIWLTDGGINVNNYNDGLDNQAVNNLCGEKVAGSAAPKHGNGAFNELRQSGAVVIGVLLNTSNSSDAREKKYRALMMPLVEGVNADGSVTCGETDADGSQPEGYVHGAFVEATSASDLALVFLKLGAAVSGGQQGSFAADGGFLVDEGVSRFSIITADKAWSLTTPSGTKLDAGDPGDAEVLPSGGAFKISVDTTPDGVGRWVWKSGTKDLDELYYFSGLAIEIDQPATFLVNADNELKGRIKRTDGRDVSLDAYTFTAALAVVADGNRTPVDSDRVEIDPATGEFSFFFRAKEASGVATLEARLDDLKTVPSSLPLASVAAQREVTVTVPEQYPTVEPLTLSDLIGADGTAKGTWTITPPANGTAGSVCFPSGLTPSIESDSADRADSWVWKIDAKLDGDQCLTVKPGAPVEVAVAASNKVAAYSKVEAALPVVFQSEKGADETIEGRLPIEFSSTRPIDAGAFGAWFFILFFGGLLVPLFIMWLVTWWFHRISRQGNLYRLQLPVQLNRSGEVTATTGESLRTMTFTSEDFKFQAKMIDARTMSDGGFARLDAKVPWWPFSRAWYQLVPTGENVILGSTGWLPGRLAKQSNSGRISGFNGDLGAVWGLSVVPSALRGLGAGEENATIPATLVVWLRSSDSSAAVYRERMNQILVPASIKPKIDRARAALAEAKPEKQKPEKPGRPGKPEPTPKPAPQSERPNLTGGRTTTGTGGTSSDRPNIGGGSTSRPTTTGTGSTEPRPTSTPRPGTDGGDSFRPPSKF